MLLCFLTASAGTMVSGESLRAHYGDHGLWNSASDAAGLQVRATPDDPWEDVTWGADWSAVTIAWDGQDPALLRHTSDDAQLRELTVLSEGTGSSWEASYQVRWSAGPLTVTRTDVWHGTNLAVHFAALLPWAAEVFSLSGMATAPHSPLFPVVPGPL